MNLLFIGDNPKAANRIQGLCSSTALKFHSVKSGLDALNLIHLNHFSIIIVAENQQLVSIYELIKKLNNQKKPHLVLAYIERSKIPQLYNLLAVGNDRWIFNTDTDEEIILRLQSISKNPLDYLKIDRIRFQINRKFGINNLIGCSQSMIELYRDLEKTVGTDITVLIQGESGSGKELVARLLHLASPRTSNRFIGLNCAAIPKELLESELFGYEKGAFTGAATSKAGKFQIADKGTLFLDEIADLDLILQSKILRMIEQREFERIGSNDTLQADVRIISASNKILEDEIDQKRFRMDLYYRINSFTIHLPPLRERNDDILPLLVNFIQPLNLRNKRKIEWFEEDVLTRLKQHHWTGNIRELENVLARTSLFTDGNIITAETLARTLPSTRRKQDETKLPENNDSAKEIITMSELEQQAIINALKATGGNITVAARKLGLSRVTIWRKIEKYNLRNNLQEMN